MNLVRKLSVGIAGSSLALMMAVAPAAAQTPPTFMATNGANGLVSAIVQANNVLNNNVVDVAVVELNNSLNNLRALNNVLNNSPILSNNDIDVVDVVDISDVRVQNFLNNNTVNVNLDDVVGVAILSGGDLIFLTQ